MEGGTERGKEEGGEPLANFWSPHRCPHVFAHILPREHACVNSLIQQKPHIHILNTQVCGAEGQKANGSQVPFYKVQA